jgi:hypothetical protein
MSHLTLAGLSEDGRRLLLVSDTGEEFTLTVDAKLRAALRGEHARIGQLEIHMDSALRPKDIQARIRAGETPEAVAQAAQTTIDRILPYANPVLAERAHVAQRAQRSSVRRKTGEAGVRTLGDAVLSMLSPLNVSTETLEWDAWRREDGRWTLTAQFSTAKRKGTAKFTFDAPGNYVTTENDDAKWLIGEAVAAPVNTGREPRDDLRQARERRLTVAPDELPLGDDALDLVNESPRAREEQTVDLTDTASLIRAVDEPDLSPTPEPLADEPVAHEHPSTRRAPQPAAQAADPAADEAPRPKKKGRASVPSWDEIMFGGGRAD